MKVVTRIFAKYTSGWLRPRINSLAKHLCQNEVVRDSIISKLHWTGNNNYMCGDILRAKRTYELILELSPLDAVAFRCLQAIYKSLHLVDEGIQLVTARLQQLPEDITSYTELLNLHLDNDDFDEAGVCLSALQRLGAPSAVIEYWTGCIDLSNSRIDDAARRFGTVLACEPCNSLARYMLARTLVQKNQRTDAIRCLEVLTDSEPNWIDPYFFLASLSYYNSREHVHLRHMTELLQDATLHWRDRELIHFTLAEALDRLGAFDAAFEHFEKGNGLTKFNLDDHVEHLREAISRKMNIFSRDFLEANRNSNKSSGHGLVFIVGMPRSGTTLVEQILATCPGVFAGGERADIPKLIKDIDSSGSGDLRYPECIRNIDQNLIQSLASRYEARTRRPKQEIVVCTDKLPGNLVDLGIIYLLFPSARFIYCKRNALDTCLSCYFKNFTRVQYSRSLRHTGLVFREYERIANYWREVLPAEIFEVNYEGMVSDTLSTAKDLLSYCGLPWHPDCINFHRTQRVALTASSLQIKMPIYKSSIGKWENYAKHLGELTDALRGGF